MMEMDLDQRSDAERFCPDPAPYAASYSDRSPGWLDELDLKLAPPHQRMGTHALDLADWFVIDEHRQRELELRERLLTERRSKVFAVLPSAESAAEEVFELISEWAAKRGLGALHDRTADAHPLIAAAQLVQDDLCLMVHRDGDWHLDGGVLTFPSVWKLTDKLGLPTAAVHDPVPHYAAELAPKVDRFFDRLGVDRPVWRRSLSLKPTNALYLPVSKAEADPSTSITVNDDGEPYWLRTERQTLRRLPRTGAILFGIRTQLAPVSVLRRRPDIAAALLAKYQSWDAAMNQFKMADSDVSNNVLPWIARVAAGRPKAQ